MAEHQLVSGIIHSFLTQTSRQLPTTLTQPSPAPQGHAQQGCKLARGSEEDGAQGHTWGKWAPRVPPTLEPWEVKSSPGPHLCSLRRRPSPRD